MDKQLLPLVSKEIGASLAKSMGEWAEMFQAIEKKNPTVADFIEKWSNQAQDGDAITHSMLCGMLVYRLLESQAEADWMNEEINLD